MRLQVVEAEVKSDLRSKFKQFERESLKISGLQRDSIPCP